MIEDLGLAETHMNEAAPNMGVEEVWAQYGYDGTGVTIAVLDTGVRGDHAGLDDMDDEITWAAINQTQIHSTQIQ